MVSAIRAYADEFTSETGDGSTPTLSSGSTAAARFVGYYHQTTDLYTKTERASATAELADIEGATQ